MPTKLNGNVSWKAVALHGLTGLATLSCAAFAWVVTSLNTHERTEGHPTVVSEIKAVRKDVAEIKVDLKTITSTQTALAITFSGIDSKLDRILNGE